MKKIITVFALIMVFALCFCGCSQKSIDYHANLGYDVSETDYNSVEFNVYHIDSVNKTWELLKTFSGTPENYADIGLLACENGVSIIFEDNYSDVNKTSADFYSTELDRYDLKIGGFDGNIVSFKTFEIKNSDEEQFFRLYPIVNDSQYSTFLENLDLNGSYDSGNVDDILITVKFS